MQNTHHILYKDNPAPRLKPAILAVLVHCSLIGVVYFGMTAQVEQPIEVELWDNAGTVESNSSTAPIIEATLTESQPPTIETKPIIAPQPPTTQAEQQRTDAPTAPEKGRESNQAAEINTTAQRPVSNPQQVIKPQVNSKTAAKPEPSTAKPLPDTSRADAATAAMMARLKTGTSNNPPAAGGSSNTDASGYISRVKQRVEAQSKLRIAGQTLNAVVMVRLAPSGDVIGKPSLQQSSGNAAWDADLMSAISRASPFPTPVHPEALKGIRLTFRH